MTWQYVDDIVIEETPETDDIVIRRVTQMSGIRRVTIYKRITLNDLKIYIVLIAKQAKNKHDKGNIIASTYKLYYSTC